ncbi:hypothetical protein ThimaDRAFT_4385 [Thiocapsa marina 5811]|uniref:Uncharacterized protein n=2 Tax=Thiocapsa marina TaxID=244573 RepID=F9UHI2_9GAMM|nr:hypothetical protein ThimaDRAFT_4385 [Thiocapsa marina 5811]
MRPLRGLSDHYNRAAVILAKTLPQPSLSDDPLMQLLQALESVETGSLAQDLDPLRSFIRSTEKILDSEYRSIASRSNTSFRDLWLPIVLLGKSWALAARSLLGIPADSWQHVDRVESIIFTPVTQREDPRLRVRLYNEVNCIQRNDYREFENCIKIPFGLRTTYKTKEARIGFLDQKSRIIETEKDDAERMLRGDFPTWLTLLLKWDAVEQIELNYRHEIGEDICKQITSIVAIPDCPSSVRATAESAETFLDNCFGWLGLSDSRARIPASALIILTNGGEEWYQLLEAYSRRIRALLYEECSFRSNYGEAIDAETNTPLFFSLIQRHLIFPPGADIRLENEFNALGTLFDFGSDGEKGVIQERFTWPSTSDLADLIRHRIGNVSFLVDAGESLKQHCDYLLKKADSLDLSSTDQTEQDYSTEWEREVAGSAQSPTITPNPTTGDIFDRLTDRLADLIAKSTPEAFDQSFSQAQKVANRGVMPSRESMERSLSMMTMLTSCVFRAILGVFSRNLDIGLEVIRLLNEQGTYSPKGTGFHSFNDGFEGDDLFKAMSILLRSAVHEESLNDRITAFAAALYVLDVNGVVPERGPDGTFDDEYCAATALVALEERGLVIPEEVSAWAFDCKANIDALLSAEKQNQINAIMSKHSLFLQNLK